MHYPTALVLAAAESPGVLRLVGVLCAAIAILLVLILRFRIQAFVSLIAVSVFVGVAAGSLPLVEVGSTIVSGMGSALGMIATIIGLGAVFGAYIEHSGGAESLARGLLSGFGEKRSSWAMMITGFLISIPIFLDVGVVILAPIIYALARKTGKSLLVFALPLLAGMAVTHAFVPPTPGPTAVAYMLGAPLGHVVLFGLLVGFPTAIVAGPILCSRLSRLYVIEPPAEEHPHEGTDSPLPALAGVAFILLIPILLMVVGSVVDQIVLSGLPDGMSKPEWEAAAQSARLDAHWLLQTLLFAGHPIIALLLGTATSLYFLGLRRGLRGDALMEVATRSLAPAGIIILVTGAGGVFKAMLIETQVGDALASLLSGMNVGYLMLAWMFATVLRIAQGSATVAMITGAALMAPILDQVDLSPGRLSLIVIVIAAGASGFVHVNDSGFWMVSRYFRMNERQTLSTFTVIETTISLAGLAIAHLVWPFV